jgi:SAM-dependent methyltransferase
MQEPYTTPFYAAHAKITRIEASRCIVFYRYLRLEALVHVVGGTAENNAQAGLRAVVSRVGSKDAPHQSFQHRGMPRPDVHEVVIEAMIDPAFVLQDLQLVATLGRDRLAVGLDTFSGAAAQLNIQGAIGIPALQPLIDALAAAEGRRPRLLDLGGRARSGYSHSRALSQCDVVVFDIVAEEGVHVVGDAHALSEHFPAGHFDFVISISVFEHLLMPWKVVLELNRVMRVGGYCLINTHQTVGMHELPWDFWRYSDTAWHGLFNSKTGFEMIDVGLAQFMHLVTVGWNPSYFGSENSGGFESSSVLVRKIGPSDLTWDVGLEEVLTSRYPRPSCGRGHAGRHSAAPMAAPDGADRQAAAVASYAQKPAVVRGAMTARHGARG